MEALAIAHPNVKFLSDVEFGAWAATKDGAKWANMDMYHTVPETTASADYMSTQSFLGYPTHPLIDLSTMQVINIDCFGMLEACIENNT